MKRALIFGSEGFVGPYLTRELKSRGYEVFGVDSRDDNINKDIDGYYKCNILEKNNVVEIVKNVNPTHIVNLAAISSVGASWKMPDVTMMVNVVGAINVLEASKNLPYRCKILFVGSSEQYKNSDKPLNEKSELDANNPYGISKLTQESFTNLYKDQYGARIDYVRAFNHTGIGQNENFVLPSFCKQVAEIEKSKKPGTIYVGNLDVVRDFSDVRDIVRAYALILENEEDGQLYNVGSGVGYSIKELLDYIISLSKQKIEVIVDQNKIRKTDTPYIVCDYTRINKQLGWKPNYSIKETLKEMFYYFLNN